MDLINQGKAPIAKIWGTNDEIILRQIYLECKYRNIDFYNPDPEIIDGLKQFVMKEES
jgi:hypothetical protein